MKIALQRVAEHLPNLPIAFLTPLQMLQRAFQSLLQICSGDLMVRFTGRIKMDL